LEELEQLYIRDNKIGENSNGVSLDLFSLKFLNTLDCRNNFIKKIGFNGDAAKNTIVNIYASSNKIANFDFSIFGNQIENIYLDNNYLYDIYATNIEKFVKNYD
jgi:Leucine-rich repeat (LRR) protein